MSIKTNNKRKIREYLPTIFSIFLILGGVAALVCPIVGDMIANQQRSTALVKYDNNLKKLSKEDISDKLEYAKKYNDNIWSKQDGVGDCPPKYCV